MVLAGRRAGGMFGISVVIYLFLAGSGAGLYLVSHLIERAYMPKARRPRDLSLLYQKIQIASLVAVGVGALFLLADLGRPEKFLLVFQGLGTSLLSLGALLIVLFVAVIAARIACGSAATRALRRLLPALDVCGAAIAVGVILYTGFFLMQMQAIPVWQTWLVVALFSVSSVSAGLALFALFSSLSLRRRRLPLATSAALATDRVALILEAILLACFIAWGVNGESAAREACRRLLSGDLACAFWALAIVGIALPLAAGLFQRRRMNLVLVVECCCVILGCFLLRYCVMASSVRSFALG